MYSNVADEYTIHEREYCYNVEDLPVNPQSMKAYIPVLMSKIQHSLPMEQTESIDTISICNASNCKPCINKRVSTLNYIIIGRYPGETTPITHKAVGEIIPIDTKFVVDILHNDIMTMYFTGIL